eukprot:SAG22_NODE_3501_length_1678_cov_5.132996_1_plen_344_part_00
MMVIRPALLAMVLGLAAAAPPDTAPLPDADPGHHDVLADAKAAFTYALAQITTEYSCNWQRGTYMIGLWSYYAASRDPAAKAYLQAWGQSYQYKLCGNTTRKHHHHACPAPPPPSPHQLRGAAEAAELHEHAHSRRRLQGACEQDSLPCVGVHNANNQLCGATYIELYKAGLDGPVPRSEATLADVKAKFAAEMAAPGSSNFWSWLDAAFMAMNTWARLAEVTGDVQYYEKQWANFNAAMLLPANGDGVDKGTTFGFCACVRVCVTVSVCACVCRLLVTFLLVCLQGMTRSTCSTATTAMCIPRHTGGGATAGRWGRWWLPSKMARTTPTGIVLLLLCLLSAP